ncbi:MAG: hypothetical protein WC549_01875 [Actinomycetota bacterium]
MPTGAESAGVENAIISPGFFSNKDYLEAMRVYAKNGKLFEFMSLYVKDSLSILRVISEKFGRASDIKDFKFTTRQDYEAETRFNIEADSSDDDVAKTSVVKLTNDAAGSLHTNHVVKVVPKRNDASAAAIYMAPTGATASTTLSTTNYLGETCRVLSVDEENSAGAGYTYVKLKRYYPVDSPAAALVPITTHMQILIVNNLRVEDGLPNPPVNKNIEIDWNYIQTSSESFGVSSHVKSGIETFGNMQPMDRAYLIAQEKLMKTVEYAIVEGRRSRKEKKSKYEYQTGGYLEFIPSANYIDYSTYGIITPDTMRSCVSDIADRAGSSVSELWWFCGKDFLLKLDQAYEDKIQYTKAEGESLKYELKVKEFTDHSSNTRMLFVPAKVLDNLGYSNEAHVLNLSPKYQCFQIAQKEPFVEKTDLEAKGQYSEWHELYGMWGMVRRLPETHFRIYNAA